MCAARANNVVGPTHNQPLDKDLRGHLETNEDILTRITKPVSIDDIGALSAQSEGPILFENIKEFPDFRLCDILVKHRWSQCRALGVPRDEYLPTLARRLRQPPRGFVALGRGTAGAGISDRPKCQLSEIVERGGGTEVIACCDCPEEE